MWECSHLGGDRFAANVLVLPAGLLYGRVLPFAAPEFVAAAEAGEVVGALLRGRIGLPPARPGRARVRATSTWRCARDGELRVVHDRRASSTAWPVVRLRWPHGRPRRHGAGRAVAADGLTCANPQPNRYVAYRPVSIEPAESTSAVRPRTGL